MFATDHNCCYCSMVWMLANAVTVIAAAIVVVAAVVVVLASSDSLWPRNCSADSTANSAMIMEDYFVNVAVVGLICR